MKSAALRTRTLAATKNSGRIAFRRLRAVLWPIVQTSIAAGLAWYIARDVFGHPEPFFAPIAAAVCLSASDVMRTQRAIQMIIGVTFGIGLGAVIHAILGPGSIGIAVAVLVSLSGSVIIARGYLAQGLMFYNQVTVSATLVITVSRGADIADRLQDTLIGGGLAIVFAALLFPGNPFTVLGNARADVLNALNDVLVHSANVIDGRPAAPGWPVPDLDRVHKQLGALILGRMSARQTLLAPRRWSVRERAHRAEQQTIRVAILANSVLHLSRIVAPVDDAGDQLAEPGRRAISELAAGIDLVEKDPVLATAHARATRECASAIVSGSPNVNDVALADAVRTCANDLQQLADLSE